MGALQPCAGSCPKTPQHSFDLEMSTLGHRGNVSTDGKDSAPCFWISISAGQLKGGRLGMRVLRSPFHTQPPEPPGKPTDNCMLGNHTCPARHRVKHAAPAWSSLAASGQDTTVAPGWWPQPDTSQRGHHPALPACPHRAHQDTRLAPIWCFAVIETGLGWKGP